MQLEFSEAREKVWLIGVKDTMPLIGGITSVAISFGIVASESGFSFWEAVTVSALMHAGASQFMFVAMVATDAPTYLIIISTLLINGRHIVYGPNLAPYISKNYCWLLLMHSLTDQLFALAHNRLPRLVSRQRIAWFSGAALTSWFFWVLGTALGAFMGGNLIEQLPYLSEAMSFALPAFFIVLLVPQFNSFVWFITLLGAVSAALLLKLLGYANVSILFGAISGTALYYVVDRIKLENSINNE